MKATRHTRTFRFALLLAAVCLSLLPSLVSADKTPTLRDVAETSRTKAAKEQKEKLRKILARQKGDQLKVYLKESTGTYVNGTSVSADELATIVRESGLDQAVITAALEVAPARVDDVQALLKNNGVKDVQSNVKKLSLREVAIASREQAARKHENNLREILARQKGDTLRVYVRNGTALFVNSKQISTRTLATVAKEAGLKEAAISTEQRVPQARIDEIRKVLQQNGAKNVTVRVKK